MRALSIFQMASLCFFYRKFSNSYALKITILTSSLRMLVRGILLTAYFYIYENWRIYELPWNSVTTWVIAALLADLGYYWVHRASHGKILSYQESNPRHIVIKNHMSFQKSTYYGQPINYTIAQKISI